MIPVEFEYLVPSTLPGNDLHAAGVREDAEALLAGGQSLFLPMMKLRIVTPSHLVDLSQVPGSLASSGRAQWIARSHHHRRDDPVLPAAGLIDTPGSPAR